jgi:hypothetical protein
MNLSILILAALCGFFLAVSFTLFLVTAARRHTFDNALTRAAAPSGHAPGPRQLGVFEGWSRDSRFALAVPERRWTYDQDYMIEFIKAARSQRIPTSTRPASIARETHGHGDTSALDYYAQSVLRLDIWFAITFAALIACAALLAAEWLAGYPWLARAWVISACMAVIYGAADVVEDITLRRIFNHAQKLAASKKQHYEALPPDTAEADAAQVDAVNAVTRVKFCAMLASIIGFVVFGMFLAAGFLMIGAPTSGDPTSGITNSETQADSTRQSFSA